MIKNLTLITLLLLFAIACGSSGGIGGTGSGDASSGGIGGTGSGTQSTGILNDTITSESGGTVNSYSLTLKSSIDSIDYTNNTLSMFGLTIQSTSSTTISDNSSGNNTSITFNQLTFGDYVTINGLESNGEIVSVSGIEKQTAPNEWSVQGRVNAFGIQSFDIVGISINYTGSTNLQDASGNTLTLSEFSNSLSSGNTVLSTGDMPSTTPLAAGNIMLK